jgi:tellurite resistance protein TehA-like permease
MGAIFLFMTVFILPRRARRASFLVARWAFYGATFMG